LNLLALGATLEGAKIKTGFKEGVIVVSILISINQAYSYLAEI